MATTMADEQLPTKKEQIVRKWIRTALPWVLLAAAAWLALSDFTARSLVETGTEAPVLEASLASGEVFALAQHRGEPVVVNFWATWCGPCRAEAPALTRIHNRLARSGGLVVGISADRLPLDQVAQAARGLGMEYPIARAPEETFARFRVTELPTTYVVSPEGRVVWSHVGAINEEELGQVLADYL